MEGYVLWYIYDCSFDNCRYHKAVSLEKIEAEKGRGIKRDNCMGRDIKSRPDHLCIAIFTLCLSVRFVEYFLIETDKTAIGENVLHKAVGIPYGNIPSALSWIFSRPDNHSPPILFCISGKSGQSAPPQSSESPQRSTKQLELFYWLWY